MSVHRENPAVAISINCHSRILFSGKYAAVRHGRKNGDEKIAEKQE
jgi:hypothetical protein